MKKVLLFVGLVLSTCAFSQDILTVKKDKAHKEAKQEKKAEKKAAKLEKKEAKQEKRDNKHDNHKK